jgi:hypothetical protein
MLIFTHQRKPLQFLPSIRQNMGTGSAQLTATQIYQNHYAVKGATEITAVH